jgi:hypothetical protein
MKFAITFSQIFRLCNRFESRRAACPDFHASGSGIPAETGQKQAVFWHAPTPTAQA